MIHIYMLQLEPGRFIKSVLLVIESLYLFQTVLLVVTGGVGYYCYLFVINGRKEKE
jgi:hypothetical protein